ncbi:MAG: HEAT repeat domain-containing protein [Chlamydiales bacterium]|nr:HEAT repeat domain-containing protein [Chlamydiales bacterium]
MPRSFPSFFLCSILFLGAYSQAEEANDILSEKIEPPPLINKLHIPYLLRSKEWEASFQLYKEYQKQLGTHDPDILQQMALIILEQGIKDTDSEAQLISLFGAQIAGIDASIDVLESGIQSPHPETQIAAIQYLSRMQEDRSEELLTKAMSSAFFPIRMEAAYHLALRKSRTAVGQIESLMYRVPPPMRFFFPQLFALAGTSDAIVVLRQLMDDPFHQTRIEAILNAAFYGRDDLLPTIRAKASHPFPSDADPFQCDVLFAQKKRSPIAPYFEVFSYPRLEGFGIPTPAIDRQCIDCLESNPLCSTTPKKRGIRSHRDHPACEGTSFKDGARSAGGGFFKTLRLHRRI